MFNNVDDNNESFFSDANEAHLYHHQRRDTNLPTTTAPSHVNSSSLPPTQTERDLSLISMNIHSQYQQVLQQQQFQQQLQQLQQQQQPPSFQPLHLVQPVNAMQSPGVHPSSFLPQQASPYQHQHHHNHHHHQRLLNDLPFIDHNLTTPTTTTTAMEIPSYYLTTPTPAPSSLNRSMAGASIRDTTPPPPTPAPAPVPVASAPIVAKPTPKPSSTPSANPFQSPPANRPAPSESSSVVSRKRDAAASSSSSSSSSSSTVAAAPTKSTRVMMMDESKECDDVDSVRVDEQQQQRQDKRRKISVADPAAEMASRFSKFAVLMTKAFLESAVISPLDEESLLQVLNGRAKNDKA